VFWTATLAATGTFEGAAMGASVAIEKWLRKTVGDTSTMTLDRNDQTFRRSND
jgi:hypothetical protein